MAEEKKPTALGTGESQTPQTQPAAGEDPVQREAPGGQPPPGNPGTPAPAGKGSPKSKKKRGILFLAVLFGLLILLILLNTVDFAALAERFRKDSPDVPVQTAQFYPEVWFEIPDYEEDITADSEYMALRRDLTYRYGNESFGVTNNPESHGPLCVFWYNYRDALVAGDVKTLNSMHVDDFVAKMRKQGEFTEGYEKGFAPQKIFNFEVTLRDTRDLQSTGDANGNYRGYVVYYFEVSYQIKDNNGTFRRDFVDDSETVPLVYEVLERGNDIRINSMSRIRTVTVEKSEEGINYMMYIWIGLILLSIIAELTTTALVAVWFIPAGIVSLVLSIILPERIAIQIVTYVAVSALMLILTRPLVKRRLQKDSYQPTNADMVVGKTAIVTERIDNIAQTGEVSVGGKRWTARSADGSVIEPDQMVSVLEIQGVKLICKKTEQ